MLFRYYIVIGLLMGLHGQLLAQFTEIAGSIGINTSAGKRGGIAWGDFNNDGCLDLIVNTNDAVQATRLYLSDCNLPNPGFTDVTATYAAGLLLDDLERSVVWADLNNDGYIDIVRNKSSFLEVYLNKGPDSLPAYSFGDVNQDPNIVISGIPGGTMIQGLGVIDYNSDGWLDLAFENGTAGIDIYENPADSTANFFHATPNGNSKGLPEGPSDGGYASFTDYDNDGHADILARKNDTLDLWINNSDTTFSPNSTFNDFASNGNWGGVLFCDFDNDGDFDIYWGDAGTNQIWEQTGLNSGNFTATSEPATSSGVPPVNIDGCACGDVDNDGDMDLFLASDAGASFLYLNDTSASGVFAFTQSNLGINVNADAEGCAFGDYDNDGDLDLYVNIDGGNNQLWRNNINDTNYVKIRTQRCLPDSNFRDDIGATMILKDCKGAKLSGRKEVNGGMGYGSQDPAVVHFGLPLGPDTTYYIEVCFITVFGSRDTVIKSFVPSALSNQTLTVTNCEASDNFICSINVDAGSRDTICAGSSVVIGGSPTVSDGTPPYIYAWIPAGSLNNAAIANPTATPSTSTSYIVSVTDSNSFQGIDTVTIMVNSLPNISTGNDTVILTGDSVLLNASGFVTYTWVPSSSIVCDTCASTSAFPSDDITYYVTGIDLNGCANMDSITITVISGVEDIVVYNAISPNGDGINDKIVITGISLFPDNEFVVFNRWGDELISLKNYDNNTIYWDGKNIKGDILPEGVYYYVLKIAGNTPLSGYIHLEK